MQLLNTFILVFDHLFCLKQAGIRRCTYILHHIERLVLLHKSRTFLWLLLYDFVHRGFHFGKGYKSRDYQVSFVVQGLGFRGGVFVVAAQGAPVLHLICNRLAASAASFRPYEFLFFVAGALRLGCLYPLKLRDEGLPGASYLHKFCSLLPLQIRGGGLLFPLPGASL